MLRGEQPWAVNGRNGAFFLGYLSQAGTPQGDVFEFYCGGIQASAPQKDIGAPPCGSCVGDPIDTGTGNVYVREEDFKVSRWLKFTRTYNSAASALSDTLGNHWLHSYSRRVIYEPPAAGATATAAILRGDGHVFTYMLTSAGWAGEPDVSQSLSWVIDSSGNPTQWIVGDPQTNETETYDSNGNLIQIKSADSLITNLFYSTAATPATIAPIPGLLISVTDPQGRGLQLTYNTDGRLSTATSPTTSAAYGYDQEGDLTSVTYSGSAARAYFYNETSHVVGTPTQPLLTGIQDESGSRFVTYDYDATGRGVGTQEAGGANHFTITYAGDGSSTFTDPLGTIRKRTFTELNGVAYATSIDGPCGSCDKFSTRNYDLNGKLSSAVDFNGNTTSYTYDNNFFLQNVIEGENTSLWRFRQTIYDPTLHVPSLVRTIDVNGRPVSEHQASYNSRAQPTVSCDYDDISWNTQSYICGSLTQAPTGVRQSRYSYCEAISTGCPLVGLLLTEDGPRTDVNDVTTYTYYATSSASGCGTPGSTCHQAGDLYTVQDAFGRTTTYASYDGAGRVTRITDPNGTNTDITYDPRGRVLTRSYGGATTTYGYDPVGNLTQVTDPDNVVTHYTYDAARRLTDVTDALGNHIHYTLDNAGNKTAETVYDASNTVKRSIGRTFNALGQLTALRDGLNNTVLNSGFTDSYDANGNLVHTADALGVQRQSSFDSLNRLITTLDNYNGTDPATQNTSTQYGYDAKDNLVQVTDPSNLVTTYTVDGLGNQTALASPDTGTATATFDAAGNQLTRTDARGIVATSSYDALNRIVSTTYADTSLNVAYHYDEANGTTGCTSSQPLGRLTRVVEVAVTTTYCYDARGNVIRKMQTQGSVTDTTAMAYTSGDRMQSLTYPSGTVVSYTRNANGQVSAATLTPAGGTAASAVSNMVYLPFGPVLSYTLGNGQTVTRTYDANYAFTDVVSPALAIHVARDAVGNVVALGNASGASPATETYIYDSLYRLTGVTDGASTIQAFTYNATGDRLSKTGTGVATGTYSYDTGTHHLNAVGNDARVSDGNGNTTVITSAGQAYGFGYNGRNQMTVAEAGSQSLATYNYNFAGQRVLKSSSVPTSTEVRYSYAEQSQILEENGNISRSYIWVDYLPIAVVDFTSSMSEVSYVHADGLNTSRAITASSGQTVWQWPYSINPFGESDPVGTKNFNLRFPGQYFDQETELLYNMNRYYSPSIGRYISSDPIGLSGGLSTYQYVSANPLDKTDPLGLASYSGFSTGDEQKLKAAVQNAIEIAAHCNTADCQHRPNSPKELISKIAGAHYVFDPNVVDCGLSGRFFLPRQSS
jgi:RHS repeat-associated protein